MTPRPLLFQLSVAVCVCEIDYNGLCTEEGVIPVQQLCDALPSELTEHMETLWISSKHKHTHLHTLAALTVETRSASRADGYRARPSQENFAASVCLIFCPSVVCE